jgi:ADP-ribosylglycohydrolase
LDFVLRKLMENMVTREDRINGCLFGGAIGDALGAPVEFKPLWEIRSKYGRKGVSGIKDVLCETNGKQTALITDDTQMTLFTVEGFIRLMNCYDGRGSCDPMVVMRNAYVRWLKTQYVDTAYESEWEINSGWLIGVKELNTRRAPGNTCLKALRTGEPVKNSKGCGGVMRVAPLGFLTKDPFSFACDAAAITHGHPSGYLSAGFLASMIADIAKGEDLPGSIEHAKNILKTKEGNEECLDAVEKAVKLATDVNILVSAETVEKIGRGWVGEEALAISIYCSLVAKDDFKKGVLLAVNHSGDSDSTGAITGNILGAYLGMSSIPNDWIMSVELNDVIRELAADMIAPLEMIPNRWEKYPPF